MVNTTSKNIHSTSWKYSLFLVLVLLFSNNFFEITNFKTSDFAIIILLFASVFLLIKYFKEITIKNLLWIISIILIPFILAITSSIQSYKLYEQPFLLGFRAQRNFVFYPLFFIIVLILKNKKKINFQTIYNIFLLYSWIQIMISFFQALVFPEFIFINNVVQNSDRIIPCRIYFDINILIISLITTAFFSFRNKRVTLKNFCFIICGLLYLILIAQGRVAIFSLIISLFILFLIFFNKKIFYSFFLYFSLFFFIFLILRPNIYVLFCSKFFWHDLIRSMGSSFYLSTIYKYPLFGGGFINSSWEPSFYGALMDKWVFTNDLGILGFIFQYGFFGFIYFLILYLYLFALVFKNRKDDKYMILFTIIIFNLVSSPTRSIMGIFPGLYAQVILGLFSKHNLFPKRNNKEENIIKETMIFNNY